MHNQCKQIYKQSRLIIPKLGSEKNIVTENEHLPYYMQFVRLYMYFDTDVHVWEVLYSKISSLSTAN